MENIPLLLLEVFLVSLSPVLGNPAAKDLYKELLYSSARNYSKEIRPVQNGSETMIVKTGLRLSQIVDLVSFKLSPSVHSGANTFQIEFKKKVSDC